ncbi:MAG: PAS domain-containing protein, partial [Burkholderiales bacterium]|nr:PAS domain-containing protein [Burkholderiales bacterium]
MDRPHASAPEPSAPDTRAIDTLLFDAAPVALVHLGPDRRVRTANRAAQALLGPALHPGSPWAPDPASLQVRSQPLADGGWVLAVEVAAQAAAPAPQADANPEAQLALAATLSKLAIWRHDLATDRVQYNDQAYRLLGLAPRPEGLHIGEIRALTHADDLPRVLESNALALRNGEPADLHVRYRQSDGSWRHVLTRRILQRDADGRPIAFLGVALDITERIEQERRADEATRRFEMVTRAAGIGYWQLDAGAERAVWSPELRALFALPPAQPVPTLQEWLQRCVHEDDRDEVRQRLAQWVASGDESLALALRIVRHDGAVRHVATHSHQPRRAAGPPEGRSLFGIVIDVTERREAELALRSASESAALVARSVGLGTWSLDPQTGEARWDAQMWVLRGRPPQPRAMTLEERRACQHPDDRETFGRILAQAIEQGTPVEQEFRVIWPDGSVHWLASRSLELVDAHSGRRRRIGVNWDVTDSRNAAAARQASELARRESQAKSRFLARMSHELRTPLNAVLGFSQLLLADDRGADPAAATRRRRLQHVRLAGQHLLTLIND